MTKESPTLERACEQFMQRVKARDPGQFEFHQAVHEVVRSVLPVVLDDTALRQAKLLERLVEPDRIVSFRVVHEDDEGEVHVHRAWRVQYSLALGPYKGGLRLHPSVNESILKFLGFEQIFKNSLTGLSLGAGKGGSDFDPRGKSDREIARFCQALMRELYRHIGEDTDVPAGDIGVGAREIGFLFGAYRRLANRFTGTFTGKGLEYGGSLLRTEATGYGAVYFAREVLRLMGESLEAKVAVVSGSGNVALYAMQKLDQLGARAVTASDSGGFVYDPEGITGERLEYLRELKEVRRERIRAYVDRFPHASYHPGRKPWGVKADLVMPCATQNELGREGAQEIANHRAMAVVEGANMPVTAEAAGILSAAGIRFAPGKAANAGGVATSGLEMSQNSVRLQWKREEVDHKLEAIMLDIHNQCVNHGRASGGKVDYVRGANLAGFHRVAKAMLAHGLE